ncbi:MAG: hypothetical protein ABSA84_01610 [Gammaproteobacteria bacterium]|jgi:hypothetical protein
MPKKTLDNKENILKLLTKLDETNSALKSRLIYLDAQLKTISNFTLPKQQLENYNELLNSMYTNVLVIKNVMDEYMLNPQRLELPFSSFNKNSNKDLASLTFELQKAYDKYTNFLLEYNTKYQELANLISSKLSNSSVHQINSKPKPVLPSTKTVKPILKHPHTKESSPSQKKQVRFKGDRK